MKTPLLTVLSLLLCASIVQAGDERFAPSIKLPTRNLLIDAAHASSAEEVQSARPAEQADIYVPLPKENPLRRRRRR
jgi:hypothetical protein